MPIILPKNRPPTTPGEVIKEDFLVPLEISQAELARRMRVPTNRISQLIAGKRNLTAETAYKLEVVLGMSAETWLRLQQACDMYAALKLRPTRGLKRSPELKSA